MSDRPLTREERNEIRRTFFEAWPAWVHFDGWAGRDRGRVTVIDETRTRWRVMFDEDYQYGARVHAKGDIVLAPKRSVTRREEP